MAEKKYFTTYDSGITAPALAQQILDDPDLPEIDSIIIGVWDEEIWDSNPNAILEMIVNNKEQFMHVKSLFVGDMTYEENEISWIKQGDYEELLKALPNLQSLKIKGADELQLGKINHVNLEELEIMCGGLPGSVVADIKSAELPSLKKLVLYAGVEDYGYSCVTGDFVELATKDKFPNLKYLGFLNAQDQDNLLKAILESDLLPQLEGIDVSFGCLTDAGGQLILDNAGKLSHIKMVVANYHYMSEQMVGKLQALPFDVYAADPQELYDEDDDMWPMITE